MKLLMCRPEYYGIEYEINPWMNIKFKADHATAMKDWEILYHTLLKCGAKIDLVQQIQGWPDMTFTANAGFYYHEKIILSHFKYKERQGETPYFKKWFKENNFDIIDTANMSYFEGAGDALFAGELLFAGFGFRTERKFYEQANFLDKTKLIYCELSDPYFYHIDTCFCPLSETLALWYPAAFTEDSQTRMKDKIELIAVKEAEAKRFACNAVVIDKQIILPTGCPEITRELEKRGFFVYACDMEEYKKSGGACKCLTLRIDK